MSDEVEADGRRRDAEDNAAARAHRADGCAECSARRASAEANGKLGYIMCAACAPSEDVEREDVEREGRMRHHHIEVQRDALVETLKNAAPHVAALREWMGIDGQIGLGAYFDDLGRLLDILDPKEKRLDEGCCPDCGLLGHHGNDEGRCDVCDAPQIDNRDV